MKFLFRLDPMMVLMLVVIVGVVITMSTQVAQQTSAREATVHIISIDSTGMRSAKNHPVEL